MPDNERVDYSGRLCYRLWGMLSAQVTAGSLICHLSRPVVSCVSGMVSIVMVNTLIYPYYLRTSFVYYFIQFVGLVLVVVGKSRVHVSAPHKLSFLQSY